ncbi:aromatic amino acid lyase [Amycolatopsis sp. NPDC059021]|uniref:aromatic amino acid lyase n=1 Tax=Amycolatopsis sp. NPDC059021 TaxID=3346704 RepID=UPI00366CCEDB
MIITSHDDIHPLDIEERIELAPELLDAMAENRARMLAALASSPRPVYGVNTGMGRLATHKLSPEQQAGHQRNLLIGRAVGGPPWLPEDDVRMLLVARLRDVLRPDAGASPELARFLADRINDRFIPAVPRSGLGSAGEIIPLSHAFQTFLGIGTVLEDGVETPAADALARRGVEPYVLGPKEGATLIQGSPLAIVHAARTWGETQQLVDLQTLAAAITIDVLGAPRDVYEPKLARGDDHRYTLMHELDMLITGSSVRAGVVQAPVSVRVGPRAITHADRVNSDLAAALRRWREDPTDSPAFLDGEFVPTTGFHAVELGLRMDAVSAALVHLGEVSVQRMNRLLDERFSGLPPQLAVDPGPQAGLVPLHKRAVGELHALRRLAAPATLGSMDTSAGQEDVQAFAWAAGEQTRAAAAHLFAITACELIAGVQAHHLRETPAPLGLRAAYAWLTGIVPPALVDRPLGPDVETLVGHLRESYFDDLTTLT